MTRWQSKSKNPSFARFLLALALLVLASVARPSAQTNVVVSGGVQGQPVVANAGSSAFSSPAWIDATAFTGSDGCAVLSAALTASTNGNAVHGEGLTGDQGCAANPFPSTFAGTLFLGASIYHLQSSSSSWVVPANVTVTGAGRSKVPAVGTVGTTLQACLSGNTTCGTNNFTTNTPLICFVSCNPAASANIGFDAQVWQMTFDCSSVSGCIAAANYWVQENSGYFSDDMRRWGNAGVGLDLCGGGNTSTSGNCQNSSYNMLNIYNGSDATACTTAAVGIRINATTGPKTIKNVTITNGGCPSGLPDDGVDFIGTATAFEQIHVETFNRAGFNAGVIRLSTGSDVGGIASQFSIKDFNSGSVSVSSGTDLIRFSNGAQGSGTASVGNAVVLNADIITSAQPQNLLNDQNNIAVTSASYTSMQQYMTGSLKQVLIDTTGTNPSNFVGLVRLGNTVRQTGTSVSNNTTTLSAWRSWTVPNSTDVSFNCKILYNQTVGAATHIVLAVSNSGATTFVGGNAEIFGAQGSATPTMAIITAAGSGVSGPTVTAVGTGTGDTYVANVTGSIEVGETAGSTSTVSIEYAAGASSTTFSIDRGSYCNLW